MERFYSIHTLAAGVEPKQAVLHTNRPALPGASYLSNNAKGARGRRSQTPFMGIPHHPT